MQIIKRPININRQSLITNLITKLLSASKITCIGILMGAVDIIPGISGGTVAFISGIYDRLMASLSHFDWQALQYLYKRQFRQLYAHLDLGFLLRLELGVLISVASMVHLINYVLTHHPMIIWPLFSGLVAASAWVIASHMEHWNSRRLLLLALGFACAWQLSSALQLQVEPSLLNFFLGGCISISAMLLPGVSGSFLLLLIGLYQPVITAIKDFDFSILSVFAAGCMVGLISFSKLINWLIQHQRQATQAFLLGLTLGALRKLWPWQVPQSMLSEHTVSELSALESQISVNVSPSTFVTLTGQPTQMALVAILFFTGFLGILSIHYLSRRLHG